MSYSSAYTNAGVNILLGNSVKSRLPQLLKVTNRPEVIGKVGGFGGLFKFNTTKYKSPILVSSVDGVGTKLKIAIAMNKHDTIGQDIVNHCINDISVIGAIPLFFLDYIGVGKLNENTFNSIISGMAKACADAKCALIGGETAQLPGIYNENEYDISGTIVGVVEENKLLDGKKTIKQGDIIIGIESNGLHTNGYSLARKILFDDYSYTINSKITTKNQEIALGDELLRIHINYAPVINKLISKFNKYQVKAFAHITGGGLIDNIPRVLPKNVNANITLNTWDVPYIFQILSEHGQLNNDELYQVFNMGIGMVTIVDQDQCDSILKTIQKYHNAWVIGVITNGNCKVKLL